MNQIARIGLDIAKRWFQVQAVDGDCREILTGSFRGTKVDLLRVGDEALRRGGASGHDA